ncbi:MAG: twin-arginine translocase TatA/TatE family subunit [Saprospiraceae bacterium]|nr:twin-arginine translocase TatA/TatE family subunit [Saprospiraceae bacterium]
MNGLLFLSNLGGYEFLLIFLVVLLLFGGRKIPELARGLGKGIREFNTAKASIEEEIKAGMKEVDTKKIEENKPEAQ